jgi:galactokinase
MNKVTAIAHGRVNLMGDHTDYNGGKVLPVPIPQYTQVTLEEIPGNQIEFISSGARNHQYRIGEERLSHSWADYLIGAIKFITQDMGKEKIGPFRATVISNIPEGAGLSSSAALEISFLKALRELFHLKISDLGLAKLGQKSEKEFVGARVGLMDQMSAVFGKKDEALFLDTQTLHFERIPLPIKEMKILVINSGISHKLSKTSSGYNKRRSECEEVCRYFGVTNMCELSLQAIKNSGLPPTLKARAKHVISENLRVKKMVDALRKKDLVSMGEIMNESHASLRDDYEVSLPEIDLLVKLCLKESTVVGARLTGGGFGGSVVALATNASDEKMAQRILSSYHRECGLPGKVQWWNKT